MRATNNKQVSSDFESGQLAARRLWGKGIWASQIDDPLTPDFAKGALTELECLQQGTPGILREVLAGAQISAEELNVESFRGLIEVVQNADDLGACEVRVAFQKRQGKDMLLIAHDGDHVRLEDVIAMTLHFISTKRDNPDAKGRFGVGLKTLGRLGNRLSVHCPPYNFTIENNSVYGCESARMFGGFYDPRSTDTLLELVLRPSFDVDEFRTWFAARGPESLIFLDTVNSLRLFDLRSKRTLAHHRLMASPTRTKRLPGLREPCRHTTLSEPRTGRSWVRYEIDKKVPKNLKRRHKAIGQTTPIGVALPRGRGKKGMIYAGLPLGITTQLPLSLNAQFDIDTARQKIHHKKLNEWLVARIAEVVTSIALHNLENEPIETWKVIPLHQEQPAPDDNWLSKRLTKLVETVQVRVRRRFNITIGSEWRRLREIAYEATSIEGLISQQEVDGLRPNLWLLPKDCRDKEGRWRLVLDELKGATLIDVEEATNLFDWEDDDLSHRDVRWFIKLARAALEEDLGGRLSLLRSVLTADDRRIVPPMPDHGGKLLLKSGEQDSLASRLGLADIIHPAYLSRLQGARVVRKWLTDNDMLHDAPDAQNTLAALAQREKALGPIALDDKALRSLRDMFEEVTPEVAKELGPEIGQVIALEVQQWKGRKRISARACPCDSYLPASIEDRKDGWSKAAARTPDINWVHPRYQEVLRRAGRRRRQHGQKQSFAARTLFRLLGVEITPRLMKPSQYETRYGVPASPIDLQQLSPLQRETLAQFQHHATHLQYDRMSSDLVMVLRDLGRERKHRQRRDRVRALFSTLEREWPRVYADHLTAEAVYSYKNWIGTGSIPASWIGKATDEPWLANEAGKLIAARSLAVRTPATEAIFGDDQQLYARELEASDASLQVVRALHIATGPKVSELVEQLREIRQSGDVTDSRRRELLYAAIAAACKRREPSPDDKVGDLSVRQLRARFVVQQTKTGLIYANNQWLPPSHVCLGSPIFGTRRAFVSERTAANRLWHTLRVTPPSVADCIDVLEEIADSTPETLDEQTLVNTYVYLEEKLRDATSRDKKRLGNLPLWTGRDWTTGRPVYVTDLTGVATALSRRIAVWQLPVAITIVPKLIEATAVTVLGATSFKPIVHKSAFLKGVALEQQFKAAVKLLQDWLARHDPRVAQAHTVPWDELAAPKVACDPHLQLELLRLNHGSAITTPARSHVSRDPLTFYFADADAAGRDGAGGKTLASLFTVDDPDKLALAWSSCWAKAGRGARGVVALAEDTGDETALETLFKQASNANIVVQSTQPAKRLTKEQVNASTPAELPVRRLKKLGQITRKTVDLVQADVGTSSPTTGRRRGLRSELPSGQHIDQQDKPASRSAPLGYSDEEREKLALQILQIAINGEEAGLRDYRHLRGVGADALDKLRRYFEIKAHSGQMPNEVTLTGNEAARAFREREEYFLAVIAGLEEGYETIVKVFIDPLHNLDLKPNTSITLSGIKQKKTAIEVRFPNT